MEVCSEKLPYVYEAPAGAFISANLTFLEISDMPILEKTRHFPDDADGGADNFSIWPDPHPIACRDQISRSGIPHFDPAKLWIAKKI